MLSPDLSATLQRAVADTRRRRHEYLTLEHLLLAMLDDPTAVDVVAKCGGEVEKLRAELEQFLTDSVEALPEDEESGPDPAVVGVPGAPTPRGVHTGAGEPIGVNAGPARRLGCSPSRTEVLRACAFR